MRVYFHWNYFIPKGGQNSPTSIQNGINNCICLYAPLAQLYAHINRSQKIMKHTSIWNVEQITNLSKNIYSHKIKSILQFTWQRKVCTVYTAQWLLLCTHTHTHHIWHSPICYFGFLRYLSRCLQIYYNEQSQQYSNSSSSGSCISNSIYDFNASFATISNKHIR